MNLKSVDVSPGVFITCTEWLVKMNVKLLIVLLMSSDIIAGSKHCQIVRNSGNKRADYVTSSSEIKCGYESCPQIDPNKLNVHLVSHSHDDVGWLKTVDQYYYGSNTTIQDASVQYILDSVVEALSKNSERRFIYSEVVFFWKWWQEQDERTRQVVRGLVNQGRLEFTGGAWSMNDEAVTHYQSIIDHFTWGMRRLDDLFGECGRPKVGWQIDPFGHSREMASIFARFGFDGLLFGRLDYQDKATRLKNRSAEFLWQGSPYNLGATSDLFTSILYNVYNPPPGFCFDILCNDTPIIDDVNSKDYNVDQKVLAFKTFVMRQSLYYTTNNVLITMGDDFHYQYANAWFKNLDKLIRYVNAAEDTLNVLYSTPSCYIKAVNDYGATYETKVDDFFPYASDPNSYWTGYYTSRPTLKYFERLGNNLLQVSKQLYSMTELGSTGDTPLDSLREAMGILQHHDSITGTEKQHVAEDYAKILSVAIENARVSTEAAFNKLISPKDKANFVFDHCLELNVSKCNVTEKEHRFVLTVYNPLSRKASHIVRFPIQKATYNVRDVHGFEQKIQIVPIPMQVRQLPERRYHTTEHDLVFRAKDLPPLGFRSYYVTRFSNVFEEVDCVDSINIENSDLIVSLNDTTGLINKIAHNEYELPFQQNFYYYEGFVGNNEGSENRSSGAYIFRPRNSTPILVTDKPTVKIYKGNVLEEIHQVFSSWLSQIIRIYKEEKYIEFEWLVGPIPIDDGVGKEVITRYTANFSSGGIFFTDSNGRELLQRKKNFRPTWHLEVHEPVSSNYYPVTSRILIRNVTGEEEVAVLTDRPQGGSSLAEGQIELMLHRRLLHDDGFGVNEALNETAFNQGLVARGKHFLIIGNRKSCPSLASKQRLLAQQKVMSPWLFFTPTTIDYPDWKDKYKMEHAGLKRKLPQRLHILTLEPWKDSTLLLRLEHIMEQNEDPKQCAALKVNIEDLFSDFVVTAARKTTLDGNRLLDDSTRLEWKVTAVNTTTEIRKKKKESQNTSLCPMEIETYHLSVDKRI